MSTRLLHNIVNQNYKKNLAQDQHYKNRALKRL